MIKTSHLLGLLALGFIAIIIGWPWWLGVGIILLAIALAAGDGRQSTPAPVYRPMPAAATVPVVSGIETPLEKPKQKTKKEGSVNDPFMFRPSIPPDGVAGLKAMSVSEPGIDNLSVGARTGTMSMYLDGPDKTNFARIRIKDDLRLNLPFMQDMGGMPKGSARGLTNLVTAHFRTSKPILKTKALEPTFESIKTASDEFADEWIADDYGDD